MAPKSLCWPVGHPTDLWAAGLGQPRDRTTEAIEAPHDERVAGEEVLQLRTLRRSSGRVLGPDARAAGVPQRVELQRGVLLCRRHAGGTEPMPAAGAHRVASSRTRVGGTRAGRGRTMREQHGHDADGIASYQPALVVDDRALEDADVLDELVDVGALMAQHQVVDVRARIAERCGVALRVAISSAGEAGCPSSRHGLLEGLTSCDHTRTRRPRITAEPHGDAILIDPQVRSASNERAQRAALPCGRRS